MTMERHRVRPDAKVRLKSIDPDDTGKLEDDPDTEAALADTVARLADLQDRLYAEHTRAVLVVLQGMDTAGKDGTVKHVFRGVNPAGCDVAPFKRPTDEEAEHDFLWRAHRWAPRKGHITIFNRSHYEDVLVPLVHGTVPADVIAQRYDQINAFERTLVENGTVILKFFLHISRDEQAERLRDRRDDPRKQWKFSLQDIHERKFWPRYMDAYQQLLGHCSTKRAPWYIVPANKNWYRNLVVAKVLAAALEDLDCEYPKSEIPAAELRKVKI
jgi:PPK2 family polyphosphate:nucleotide phosphotransferase